MSKTVRFTNVEWNGPGGSWSQLSSTPAPRWDIPWWWRVTFELVRYGVYTVSRLRLMIDDLHRRRVMTEGDSKNGEVVNYVNRMRLKAIMFWTDCVIEIIWLEKTDCGWNRECDPHYCCIRESTLIQIVCLRTNNSIRIYLKYFSSSLTTSRNPYYARRSIISIAQWSVKINSRRKLTPEPNLFSPLHQRYSWEEFASRSLDSMLHQTVGRCVSRTSKLFCSGFAAATA